MRKTRVGRAVAEAVRSHHYYDRTEIIDDFDGDLRFACRMDEHMGTQIYWYRNYSGAQLRLLDRLLDNREMVFLDVGANQGEFSVFAAKRLSAGRVFSFEPAPELNERLHENVRINGFTNVEIRSEALWNEDTTLALHFPSETCYDGSRNEGLASLHSSTATTTAVDVQCRTLDGVVGELAISRIDVIKVDVEGAEREVLQGATETIEKFKPTLLVEADRTRNEEAGVELDSMLDQLEETYRIERIERDGTTAPLSRTEMRPHEDLFCLPRDF